MPQDSLEDLMQYHKKSFEKLQGWLKKIDFKKTSSTFARIPSTINGNIEDIKSFIYLVEIEIDIVTTFKKELSAIINVLEEHLQINPHITVNQLLQSMRYYSDLPVALLTSNLVSNYFEARAQSLLPAMIEARDSLEIARQGMMSLYTINAASINDRELITDITIEEKAKNSVTYLYEIQALRKTLKEQRSNAELEYSKSATIEEKESSVEKSSEQNSTKLAPPNQQNSTEIIHSTEITLKTIGNTGLQEFVEYDK